MRHLRMLRGLAKFAREVRAVWRRGSDETIVYLVVPNPDLRDLPAVELKRWLGESAMAALRGE